MFRPLYHCLLILLFLAPWAHADSLRLYNWEYFLSQDTIDGFERHSGHSLRQNTFTDEEYRDQMISSGRAHSYDLVMIANSSLQLLGQQGFFEDLSQLQQQLAPVLMDKTVQACGRYGIPYAWGTMGIIQYQDQQSPKITSWRQLFELADEHQGHTVFYPDPIDATAQALLALGFDPFSEDEQQLQQAWALMKQQQPHVLSYELGMEFATTNQRQQMRLSNGYSGETHDLRRLLKQPNWHYIIPEEGTVIWTECLAIPKQSQHKAAARQFIQYINQAQVAADNAQQAWFATANRAAMALTDSNYRNDPELFPDEQVLQKSTTYRLLSPESLRLRNRMLYSLR